MNSLSEAKKILNEQNATCVVYRDRANVYFDRGIKPLLAALDSGVLRDAAVADRVIGKSAAVLLIKGGIRELYTRLISTHARKLLDKHGIPYTFENECEYVKNHRGDGMCPMEGTVLDIDDIDIGVQALKKAAAEMAKKNGETKETV